jgi:DUF4097 and DUF4098 domain-containing protein YvlB
VAADPNVIVSLSVLSGSITVRGWDQGQVRVQAGDDKRVQLKRADTANGNAPATRLQVIFFEPEAGEQGEECGGSTDVRLDVPRGATVFLKTQEGDIDVSDVAEARVGTSNGDVILRRLSRAVEAMSMSGDMSLRDSSGNVRLKTLSGSIEVVNIKATAAGDTLLANTVSGDVILDGVEPARVEAGTISGEVSMTGALARGGHYEFKTTSGDITLTLPESSSFKLDAQVFSSGIVDSSFPIKLTSIGSPVKTSDSERLVGTYGTGDATLNLSSFSGTLRLRKK